MNRCGCNPVLEPIEYKIDNSTVNIKNLQLPELFPIQNDLQELKNKIIEEYFTILDKLECGIHPDLEFLLEEISLVEIRENE